MYTRLTGMALNGSVVWCTLSASLALASGVSTTSPSTPAVRRPALRSVTRRTLISVLARDRSINFCRLRTFFRSPAFDAGVRFSVILFPPRSWAPLAVGLPDETCRPDPDGVTAFRTHELRPGWVPPLPRGRRCSPGQVVSLTGACRSAAASPYTPPQLPIDGGSLTRHQRGFTQFTRPVFPSPAAARMERAAASAFPRASHPADQEPTTHVEAGTGQRARTWNYSLNITSVDPPIGSSLTTCDLASHDESQQRAPARQPEHGDRRASFAAMTLPVAADREGCAVLELPISAPG